MEAQRCLPYANKTIKNSHETTILRGSQPGTILVPEKKGEVVEDEDTSSGSLGNTLRFVRPTIFFCLGHKWLN